MNNNIFVICIRKDGKLIPQYEYDYLPDAYDDWRITQRENPDIPEDDILLLGQICR